MAAQDYVAVVQQLYVSYFGRPADYYGLQSFTAQLDALKAPTDFETLNATVQKDKAGTTALSKLVNSFNASAESAALYGTDNSTIGVSKFVAAIYQNVLGREADVEGLTFWVNEILAGRLTRANAAMAITDGALNNTSDQGLLDAKTVQNKLTVATDFTDSLDTTNEINGFSGDKAAAQARDLLGKVTNTTDTAAFHATVDATIAAIVTGSQPTQTFTLTTGVDNFLGGAGNDIFNALPGASNAATFTALDSIDGGAGQNTLNVTNLTAIDLSTVAGVSVKNIQTANLTSTATVKGDVSGWTGLTNLNVGEVGGNAAGSIKAAATTNVTVVDSNLAAGNITVTGGNAVTVTAVGATTGGTVAVGSSATAGAINVTVSDAAPGAATQTGDAITVTGGTTVNVTHNIEAATSVVGTANTNTGGLVTVNGGAATTTVTVTQTAAVAAVAGVAPVVAATETAAITVGAGGLTAGQSVTIAGLTYTSTAVTTAAQLVAAFASLAAGATTGAGVATGTYSGTLTGFSTGAAVGSVITATSTTANSNVADLTFTDAASALTSVVESQGAAASAGTTAVGGIAGGQVIVTDVNSTDTTGTKANTIKTVTLDGYGAGSQVRSNALTDLTLANSAAGVTVVDNTATVTNTTLNVTVNKLGTGAALTDATIKTLNINATGAASKLNVTAGQLTTLNVAGDQKVDLSGSTVAGVTAVTSTNTAGVTVALNAGSTGTFGDGADIVTLAGAYAKTATLGAGNDTVIITTLASTASVDGGSGANTLQMAAADADAADVDNTFAGQVKNFSKLKLTGTGYTQTVDVAVLGGYNDISASGATSLTLNNTASGATLSLTGSGTAYAVNQTNATAGTSDVLNVKLSAGASTTFGTLTAAKVETINIATTDSSSAPNGSVVDTFAIAGSDVSTIKVTGTAALSLNAGSTAITSFDASGLTVAGSGAAGTGVSWTTGNLAANATISGSANGGDVINASAVTAKSVNITVHGGTNTITGGGANDTITGAAGADTINGGAGNDTIVGGGGADVITGGAGADVITISGNKATIKQAAGDSGANNATLTQTTLITAGFDVVTGAVAGDKIDLSALGAQAATLTVGATTFQGTDNKVIVTYGTFDAANGTFTYAANGADSVITYDGSAGVGGFESIILVGHHVAAVGATGTAFAAGVITLG